MNTITINTFRRPFLFKLCLESILRSQRWYRWADKIAVCIAPNGDRKIRGIAENFSSNLIEIIEEPQIMDAHAAAGWMLKSAFVDGGADCNLYVEDDVILSLDAFMLLAWMQEWVSKQGGQKDRFLGACLYHETIPRYYVTGPDPHMVHLGNGINTCGGTAFLREPFLRYIAPQWNCKKAEPTGFDYSMHYLMYVHQLYVLWPDYSRSTNTGYYGNEEWANRFRESLWVQTAQALPDPLGTHGFRMNPEHERALPPPVLEPWMKPELRARGLML